MTLQQLQLLTQIVSDVCLALHTATENMIQHLCVGGHFSHRAVAHHIIIHVA